MTKTLPKLVKYRGIKFIKKNIIFLLHHQLMIQNFKIIY